MAIVVVRGSCLLINSCVSFLSVLHYLLLDLQQRHAVILLDQHLGIGEQIHLSGENRRVSGLLGRETFFRFLLLFQVTTNQDRARTHTKARAHPSLIQRGALGVCILR